MTNGITNINATGLFTLPRIPDKRGNLSFVEYSDRHVMATPFCRAYWIYDIPTDSERHGRALRKTYETLICMSGECTVSLTHPDGTSSDYLLNRPYQCLNVPPMTWRRIHAFSSGCTLLVLASTPYSESDYIEDYAEFRDSKRTDHDILLPECIGYDMPSDQEIAEVHRQSRLDDCHMVNLKRRRHANGSLTAVDSCTPEMPFDLRRVFYLYDVPADASRGGHSHTRAQELMFVLSGACEVTLTDGRQTRTFKLTTPYEALYIAPGIWRTLGNFTSGTVNVVLTSQPYNEGDYVRRMAEFKKLTHGK